MKKIVKKILGNRLYSLLRQIWLPFKNKYILWIWKKYSTNVVDNKIAEIRSKDRIKVAFVIHELGSWKTEELYKQMLSNERFEPILLVAESLDSVYSKPLVITYFKEKNYNFYELSSNNNICSQYNSDIIFYQKPYMGMLPRKLMFWNNTDALFCYVYYSFRNKKLKTSQDALIHRFIWQEYVENDVVRRELTELMSNKASNVYVTGLPVMDELLKDKSYYPNPWHNSSIPKKRIIYAPHHSVYSNVGLWSTFMLYGDFMLELVEKYKNEVQWAFKPHPLLYTKLCKTWGKDKTDAYYNKWRVIENCQLEEGPYMGLFKHSDAMIHDCGSFMLEYHYTQNPVLYLMQNSQDEIPINEQTIEAKKAHYQAWNKEDIETFIVDVINGVDPMKRTRRAFYDKYLLPPNGLSACDNIINHILGN